MKGSQRSQGANASSSKKIVGGIVALFTISFLALTILAGNPLKLINIVKSMSLSRYVLAVLVLVVAEFIRSLRLKVLAKESGKGLRFHYCLLARFLGKFASTITPAGLGGNPTRASVIGSYNQAEIGETFGITTVETFSDTLWSSLFLIFLPLTGLTSWVITLISLFIASLWIFSIFLANNYRLINSIYSRLKISKRMICRIERQRLLFINSLKKIKNKKVLVIIVLLTITSHLVDAYGIMVLEGIWDPIFSHNMSYLRALAAIEASYVLVSVPTPGGSGGIEYGLYSFLGPDLAVRWRIVQLTVALLPGVFLAIITPRILHYIKEVSFPEVDECKEEVYEQ